LKHQWGYEWILMSVITKSVYEEIMKPALNQQILETSSRKSSAQDIYQQVASDGLFVEDVFSAISDNKSLSLFNLIAIMSSGPASDIGHPNGEILISHMNLTRKQYYTRINQLRDAGLISKKRAGFVLTSLGRIVYETQKTIGVAIQNRWKLQAIDLLKESPSTDRMPVDEKIKVINTLLEDSDKIKDILLGSPSHARNPW
jgi:hypothetical protein